MKKIAITQSNYIPWKGYFDLINRVDECVLFDDAQYTKRDWRNRNKIKTANGLKWLTIPVSVKGKYFQKINETNIIDSGWANTHWSIIKQAYSKTKFFKDYSEIFENFYLNSNHKKLSDINYVLIKIICEILSIDTKITSSTDYILVEGKTEKLLHICKQADAGIYISGPAAKDYFDISLANKMDIKVQWMDFTNYKEYNQLHMPFEHSVSILDLIFNEGPNAKDFF